MSTDEQVNRAMLMTCGVYRARAYTLGGLAHYLQRQDGRTHARVIEVLDKTIEHYRDMADELEQSVNENAS